MKTFWQKKKLFVTTFENILGKEEIVRDEQFLLLPKCFQKSSATRLQNFRLQEEMG